MNLLIQKKRKWIFAAIGFVLVLLILRIGFLVLAKPKVTVNYLAEYNKISKPANYDPNENAVPYYQKAFESFVEPSYRLFSPYVSLPADFNSIERTQFEGWLSSNYKAFEYFKIAANRPYYWLEKTADDNALIKLKFDELPQVRQLMDALIWNARLNAVQGQLQPAFEDVLCCYKAASHKCRPQLLYMEQYFGLYLRRNTISNAFFILDNSKPEKETLKFLQDALQQELDNDAYVLDFQIEKLLLYDMLQRNFLDNGRGTGRLAFRVFWHFLEAGYCGLEGNYFKVPLSCFTGPTRNQVLEKIDQSLSISGQIATKTPWQIKNEGIDYFEEIENINNSNVLLKTVGIKPENIFYCYHETKAQTEALVAVLAILRFKVDIGQYPETLQSLVSAGYLRAVPKDPYSDGPLVYKPTGENFKLYSIGGDFVDDGGKAKGSSWFGWPMFCSYPHSPDIVYWPVVKSTQPRPLSRGAVRLPDSNDIGKNAK